MRRSPLVFVLLAALAPAATALAAGSTAAPPSASATLAKMAAAAGGMSVLASIKTQVIVATAAIQGQQATLTTTVQAPNKFLQVIDVPAFHLRITKAYDGTTAWASDAYGNVKALTGDQAHEVLCEAIDSNDAVMFPDRWPVTVKAQPNQTIDGKSYLVLSVTPKGCETATLMVDPKTDLISRETVSGQTSVLSNFKKGPAGEIYAATLVVTGPQGVFVATVSSVQDNVALDPAAFTMPPPPSPSPAPAASAAPAASMAPASPSPSPTPYV